MLFARLPVDGHYFSDLFPAFIISGLGLALAFVPMSIGALTGVRAGRGRGRLRADQHDPADRRRDRRRGGDHGRDDLHGRYVDAHPGTNAFSGAALTHGFQIAFYVLAALAGLGAVLAALMLESKPAEPELRADGRRRGGAGGGGMSTA